MPPIHLTPTVRLPENGAGRIRVCWGQAAGPPPPAHRPSSQWGQPDPQWTPAQADGARVSGRDSWGRCFSRI